MGSTAASTNSRCASTELCASGGGGHARRRRAKRAASSPVNQPNVEAAATISHSVGTMGDVPSTERNGDHSTQLKFKPSPASTDQCSHRFGGAPDPNFRAGYTL